MVWSSLQVVRIDDFDDAEWKRWAAKDELPNLVSTLSIAPLEDRPQNPILDTLLLSKANSELPKRTAPPPRPVPPAVSLGPNSNDILKSEPSKDSWQSQFDLWRQALENKPGKKVGLRSWDRLRTSHSDKASSTAFLSEQDDALYSAARSTVQPRLFNPNLLVVQVDGGGILQLLKQTVLGIPSKLFPWDCSSERFIQRGTGDMKRGIVLIDGMDEVASQSYISRFLTIGNSLRRLELLVESLRTRPAEEGPTIHSFAHALSSCLVYIREALERFPPADEGNGTDKAKLNLAAIWGEYGAYHDVLVNLSRLCMREESLDPKDYPRLEPSPIVLLTRLYNHLDRAFEERSPGLIRAVLAFILTASSQEYIQRVAHTVGFGGRLRQESTRALKESTDEYEIDLDDEEEEDIFALMEKVDEKFPAFFPRVLRRILPSAQRSLILLNIAQIDHPSLGESQAGNLRWAWAVDEILALWNEQVLPPQAPSIPLVRLSPLSTVTYKPELSAFSLFDMEPGTSDKKSVLCVKDNSFQTLSAFIESFPDELPPITPTLPQFTSLIFHNLTRHARTLSSTLLSHFLDSDGILNFRSHLLVLRSFLLLSAPSFKYRLVAALLSDAGEYEVDNTPHSMSIRYFRRPTHRKNRESKQPWAVGISPNLLDRETWPPVGTDLSFFLRTVIVDALDGGEHRHHHHTRHVDETGRGQARKEGVEVTEKTKDRVTEEASWRLGFAIRDLPAGTGKEKWLDPLSIEALDFLYMDYKPPHPLEVLIPPDVLSKYQRMFAFLLRLLRVECALKSLCRMTTHRTMDRFLFPTFSASRKLLLHFRFVAQSFVSALSSYVFDTVIGGNFDFFFARLSGQISDPPSSSTTPDKEGAPYHQHRFSDVFELAEAHSSLLDSILSACLLRSGQRAMSDLLRQALEIVLELAIVIGELHRERIQEYQAGPMVEELYNKFRAKMALLTKALKGLGNKSPSAAAVDGMAAGRRSTTVGGQDALYHLVTKLDIGEWWMRRPQSTSSGARKS